MRADVKFKKGYSFPCKYCDNAFKSMTALNNHRSLEHALSFNSSKKSVEPLHSARNNSLTSCLMLEDITMSSSDSGQNPEKDSVTLDETSIKKTEKSSIICD